MNFLSTLHPGNLLIYLFLKPAFFIMFSFLLLQSCKKAEVIEPEIITLTDQEASADAERIRSQVETEIHDRFELSLWASEKLLGDPIAIDIDNHGRALITVTHRSNSGSEFDIRGVDNSWRIESIQWQSVEDRRNFLHRVLAPEKSEQNTWIPDRNEDGLHDWRDLAVVKEEVWRIEDASGNGLADRAQLFIRDFNDEVTDVAGGVLYYNDEVFVVVGPDTWRLRDTNGDGMADWKESISHGYNVHIGFSGHGMSGLRVGPDGRVYWGIGDMGFNVIDKEGNHWYYPNEGAILRSEPDGSNFEVFASGLRNTHEFDFDKHGNLITVDNDGDHPGEHERLMYLVNGSDSGWRINWQFGKYDDPKNNSYKVLMDERFYSPRFEGQAAYILPPLDEYHAGPTGFRYNPGTALSEEWKDHFFIVSFRGSEANSPIFAFTLEEEGASFRLKSDTEIMRGILPVGLAFGPDGALYFNDWIQGWSRNQQGRIWKLDTPEDANAALRAETKQLLAEDFSSRTGQELVQLLGHEDMRVRQKAQFELAGRDAANDLLSAVEQSRNQLARIHGIWGVAQISRRNPDTIDPLRRFLGDTDPEIRAQSAKMLGDVRYAPAANDLIPLLQDENARVRFFATEALGRMAHRPAFDGIVAMLEANNDEDVYLRHAGAIALERIGDGEVVANLATHPSRAVRIGAIVALKRLVHPGAARFLDDADDFIVTEASRAISDDAFIEEALPALARMLDQNRVINEPLMRRAINAALYVGGQEEANRLARFALRNDIPANLRIEAINTLEHWEEPSIFDRVTGWYRGEIHYPVQEGRNAIASVIDRYMKSGETALQLATINAVGTLGVTDAIPGLLDLVHNAGPDQVRITSLNTLAALSYEGLEDVLAVSLEDQSSEVRMNALGLLVDADFPVETKVAMMASVLAEGSVDEKKPAYEALSRMNVPSAHDLLLLEFEQLRTGELIPEVHLDLVIAMETSESDHVRQVIREYQSQKPEGDKLAQFQESLYGGNVNSGRRIFYMDVAAQCIRCHVVDERGTDVGPELTKIASRLTREQLLLSLVDPSAQPVSGFTVITITKQNGETIRGIYQDETDVHLSLVSGGEQVNIPKQEIVSREQSPSAMPSMADLLTRNQIRDLVEYISTLK
ncbi:MAG: heme-binding protein [Balneolaceae bacterium]|nr:MAG: heme-binding protein [Balneolaceae bacterium]